MKLNKKFIGICLGVGLSFSTIVGLNLNKQKVFKTNAEETPLAELTFPDGNSKGISSYKNTWTATINGQTWTIVNANNNNNIWEYIRFGSKNEALVSSITSPSFSETISKVIVTVDSLNDKYPTKMIVNDDAEKEVTGSGTASAGDWVFNIPEAYRGSNQTYKLIVDVPKLSKNGGVQISKLSYYGVAEPSSDPSVEISSNKDSIDIDETITMSGVITNAPEETTIAWSVDNSNIATIDPVSGELTGVASGPVVVTATIEVSGTQYSFNKTINVNYEENIQEISLADLLETEKGDKISYLTSVVIHAWGNKIDSTDVKKEYGNFIAKDDEGNKMIVYGATYSESALSFNRVTGLYFYTNPRDFVTNEDSLKLEVGDRVLIKCIRIDYYETKQLSCVILGLNNGTILDEFVNNYMHPEISYDDENSTGACLGEDGYYAKAKVAFNALTLLQREEFLSSDVYEDAAMRLYAWAVANGEDLLEGDVFGTNALSNRFESNNDVAIVSVILSLSFLSIVSGFFYIKKKRHQ